MRVLVACERSGRVRDAFLRRGHDAVSCDVEPSLESGPHILGRVEEVIDSEAWDLVIGFPPCTYLSNTGVSCLTGDCRHATHGSDEYVRWRMGEMIRAAMLFRTILDCGAPRVAVENPRPHKWARHLMGERSAKTEPFMFGHPWRKLTYWWLRGLAPLQPTTPVQPTHVWIPNPRKTDSGLPALGGVSKWGRSLTPVGLAEAISAQWGHEAPQTLC